MLKPSLQLRLSQQLTMTPQLQQAIRLLQLPIMDLQAQIQEALDQNVMLEVDDTVAAEEAETTAAIDEAPQTEAEPELEFGEIEWADEAQASPSEAPRNNEPRTEIEYPDHSHETLADHLLWQLEMQQLDSRSVTIGQAIIDAINDDGYLIDDLETIRSTLAPDIEAAPEEIEAVLELVQGLDPAGVGARSVSECLLLQLSQLDPDTPYLSVAQAIATDHLELVSTHQYSTLKKLLRLTDEDLEGALHLIRSCHPRPGSAVHATAAEYIVPDVFVRKVGEQWVVELNNAMAPQLKINQTYAGALARGTEHDVLKAHLQEARWLIRSLEIRNETLWKVAVTIVQRQTEFLEHGEEFMRPMVLRDVSEAIGMHESTVSRVTTNKYMHTPRGIFEFRFFFSSHVEGQGGDQSSTAVRAKIRKLITSEDSDKPLSDSQLAHILSDEGIKVARRTVAKYRESMNIPSSSDRRRAGLIN
jgi:RNA polymerase sigma-54 factor